MFKDLVKIIKSIFAGQEIKELEANIESLSREILLLRCEKLFWAIGFVVAAPVYVKDSIGRNETYCNVAAYDLFDSRCNTVWNVSVKVGNSLEKQLPMGQVIQAYDYDLGNVLPNDDIDRILSAPIKSVFDECIIESKNERVRLVTQKKAQELANKGIPVLIVSKKYNHVAVACPHLKWEKELGKAILYDYDENLGCFTGNAGNENDFMYMSDKRGFGLCDWKSERDILYVQFKKVGGTFDE